MTSAKPDNLNSVTVVVPTRNRAGMLRSTLHSILSQKDVSLSLVVVDDASNDETSEVVQGIHGARLIRHENPTEQPVARNHGAGIATTPWVAFCDDDDLWAPMKLRKQLDALVASGADWCTVSALHVTENLIPIGGKRLSDADKLAEKSLLKTLYPGAVRAFSSVVACSSKLAVLARTPDT